MHAHAHDFVARTVTQYGPFHNVVEFGSLDVNGSIRGLFPDAAYWGIDIQAGPGVDEVRDATEFVPHEGIDCVACVEVLEHAPDVAGIVRAASEALTPGGVFIVTCATDPREPHGTDGGDVGDEHYQNVDPAELRSLLEQHQLTVLDLEAHRDRGDLYAVGVRRG